MPVFPILASLCPFPKTRAFGGSISSPVSIGFFHVGAANYRSVVWINGKRLCDHEGGYTPYDCDSTTLLHAGGNFVVVAVDSTRRQEDIPSLQYDFANYGGLTRDVLLVTVPTQFIDDYEVQLKHGPSFDLKASSKHWQGMCMSRVQRQETPSA